MNCARRSRESGRKFFWPVAAAALLLASVALFRRLDRHESLSLAAECREGNRRADAQKCVCGATSAILCVAWPLAIGAAVVIGIPLGLTLGWYPAANQVVNPVLQILRPISPIAWIPVAIIFFAVSAIPPRSSWSFLERLFPIVVACVGGVSSVPSDLSVAPDAISVFRHSSC